MPLYEYECAGCGKRFELIQKFSDPPEATCVICGGRARRLLSPPALQFKGSGWYVTDYARRSAGQDSGKSSPGERGEKADGRPAAGEKPAADSAAQESKTSSAAKKPPGSSA